MHNHYLNLFQENRRLNCKYHTQQQCKEQTSRCYCSATRPTHPFWVDKWVVSCNQMSATSVVVAPSGECLRSEGLVWLVGAMVCLLASCTVSVGNGSSSSSQVFLKWPKQQRQHEDHYGWPHTALQHHQLLPISYHFRDSKERWSGYRVGSAIRIRSLLLPSLRGCLSTSTRKSGDLQMLS